jgi:hypothetical protein
MAYHKRPATTRTCVHCLEAYQAVDRRRLYCSSSCKVQACKAKRRRRLAAKGPALAAPITVSATSTTPLPQTLDWSLQNFGVLSAASAFGTLGVKLGEQVVESLKQPPASAPAPPAQAQLVDPLNWLPAGLLTGAAPRVPITSNTTGKEVIFVQLQYLGHTLYYQPSQRLLLWRAAPGELRLLTGPEQVALMAEQVPCETESQETTPNRALAPGRVPQFLG